MNIRLLNIFNLAPLYRIGIFEQIDKEFKPDWIFGDAKEGIKELDLSTLSGRVTKVRVANLFGGCYYQCKVVRQLFSEYTHFLISGDQRCISTWFLLFMSLFFPKKKIYSWSHGLYGKEGRIRLLLIKFFYKFVDGAFIYSNYSRDLMIEKGINPDKLHVIHNSLDYSRQIQLRSQCQKTNIYSEHFGNNNKTLIFIGRLTSIKRLDILISAIALLKGRNFLCNVVFVGDGQEKDALNSLSQEMGVSNQVWFYGECYNESVNAELIFNSDLCVAPGNVGLTAMHSMVFGTPVITHNEFAYQMPEFEAIHENVTGSFFKKDDVVSLCDAIQRWFAGHPERDKIRQFCYKEIDGYWNPDFQMNVLKSVLIG